MTSSSVPDREVAADFQAEGLSHAAGTGLLLDATLPFLVCGTNFVEKLLVKRPREIRHSLTAHPHGVCLHHSHHSNDQQTRTGSRLFLHDQISNWLFPFHLRSQRKSFPFLLQWSHVGIGLTTSRTGFNGRVKLG